LGSSSLGYYSELPANAASKAARPNVSSLDGKTNILAAA